jgi:arylsulfatase A-like enzyme
MNALFLSAQNTQNIKRFENENTRSARDKPNFILIVADDLGFADLGFNGSTQIKTPNIDELANTGVKFSDGYVSSPVCSPSRAGLLTGINQVEFGHDNNVLSNQPGFDPEFLGLPIDEITIADKLKPLGYRNGLIGKWHLGEDPQFHPLNRGFDDFWGFLNGGHDYFTSTPAEKGSLRPIECNYKTPDSITYITDDIGNECVNFIERYNDHPFFLFASFNAPHAPMQAATVDLELYKHIKDLKRRTYAAMVHRLDINVGKIMRAIKQQGLSENTFIVFISDNGGPVDHNGSLNAPYNGQKGMLLEGGIHIPFVMNWSKILPSGLAYTNPVSTLDIMPTFLELAGEKNQEAEKYDGVNLIPYLLGKDVTLPHQEFKWRFSISSAIRCGDWKLVRIPDRLPYLFHLSSDISEQNNVALKNIEKTEELLKKLGDWEVSLPHPLFLEAATWKRSNLDLYNKKFQIIQP